jgi:hypothetical protein
MGWSQGFVVCLACYMLEIGIIDFPGLIPLLSHFDYTVCPSCELHESNASPCHHIFCDRPEPTMSTSPSAAHTTGHVIDHVHAFHVKAEHCDECDLARDLRSSASGHRIQFQGKRLGNKHTSRGEDAHTSRVWSGLDAGFDHRNTFESLIDMEADQTTS